MATNPYSLGLDKNPANYVPLTPVSFLARAAHVYPDRVACIHGARRTTYGELYVRSRRLASALVARGVGIGDTVAVMAPNVPAILEAHYAVPMTGAVLNTLNTRLDAASIGFILDHGEAKVLIADREFSATVKGALEKAGVKPLVIDFDDPAYHGEGDLLGEVEYEDFVASGDPDFEWRGPADEWQAISLNYTSGTTGNPKGVVYSHRGAYLTALGNVLSWNMPPAPVYLWTLPMFHCNGWCFPWTIAAVGGTHVCLRRVEAGAIFKACAELGVTHFCGAPIVLGLLINASDADKRDLGRTVEVMTAAAPPPSSVIEAMEAMGFHITHVYGLTESYGPAVSCDWQDQWDGLPAGEQATLKARQGVAYTVLEGLMVADAETLAPCPADGETMGEVMMRGNLVMKGYFKNPDATEAAFEGGWFRSGDLGVMHPDGYIQLKDRSKDIIISGGENISSIEVENTLYRHPAIVEAAVVAREDDKWGETPCAFVDVKPDAEPVSEADIIAFCRDEMAHFKVPRAVVFGPLPKTSTGKVQKFLLRDRANAL